jgi:alpha-glucosidase (family GH31 glycosyl hydrolase)
VLVATVFTDEGDVEFYLPEGPWIGLLDGQPLERGR